MCNVANIVLDEPLLGFEPRCATIVRWQDRRNVSVPVFRAQFAGYCGCCHAFILKKPWGLCCHHFSWIYILYCHIIRSFISIFYIAVLSEFITVTVCTSQIICTVYFRVQRVQYSTACLWLQNVQFDVCVRNKIYVTSLSARRILIVRFLKIYNVILLHFCKCNIFFIE